MQKVLKIGNSLGTTFPKSFVDRNKIKPGMQIDVSDSNGSITYSTKIPKATKYESVDDAEFLEIIKDVEKKYGKALDDLANLE
jgi:antitoxin component of MazEF toxin-antitoxin module